MIKDFYIQENSPLHNLNFWTKFFCFLLLLPLAGFLAPPFLLMVIIAIFIVLLILSKINFNKFWGLTKIYFIPITIGVIILSLFFSLGSLGQRLSEGLILALRFIALISFGMLFSMVTNPIEIPAGLLKAKIPHKYGITIMVAFRMLPLISQKIKNIVDAQKARGADFKISFQLPSHAIALMVPVLHSTLETSVKLSDTLISRGYNPDGKITIPPQEIKITDGVILFLSIAVLLISLLK
ncbi:MAG: energy-coupling factor transporter transmembrane component T [Candidatus Pacebacteria bacterium]|nr:energy-coupling factor transporter transmembrane component T [Candidatus Paceibacterota bacterium]